MDIDVILDSQLPPSELTELGLLAERVGLRTVWLANMLDGRDPFVSLAGLAARSSRIRLAPMALNAYEMHPFRIGLSLLTLNELCGGRAQAMIGGGGEPVMALGIPFRRRVRHVRECVEIVRGMVTARPFTYEGELFRIAGYDPAWITAPAPPLYVGANRPQMLQMAARVADGVILSDLTPSLARGAIQALQGHMQAANRDPGTLRVSNFLAWYVYDDPAEARHEARRWIGFRALFRRYLTQEFLGDDEFQLLLAHMPAIYAMGPRNEDSVEGLPDDVLDRCVDRLTLTGGVADLDRIVERLLEYRALGLTEVCIELKKHQAHGIRLLGERVLPRLR